MEALTLDIETSPDPPHRTHATHFFTSLGTLKQAEAVTATLANRSFDHAITGVDSATAANDLTSNDDLNSFTYVTTDRYTSKMFYGIMIDTGASTRSTAGYGQYLAYKNHVGDVSIDRAKANAVEVKFGIGSTSSVGSVMIKTPIGSIEFHVVKADTPFLLCLADMDSLQVHYNNLRNVLVTPTKSVPVVRRFGHPFLIWESLQALITESFAQNPCYLTDVELRQLHRRFGHPSAMRLYNLLERAGHSDDLSKKAIDKLTKFCTQCQKHGKSPGRFKFTLREDVNFNYSIITDIMYIDGSPILHVIDEATRFQAARWLNNISAKHTWDVLRLCWIDTYVGPPDYIVHDAGTNFVSKEFRQFAHSMSITTKSVPVEAHWSIGMVERYHAVLRRAHSIIIEELGTETTKEMALQMAVKAVNDTAGPEGLVPTLLVFGAYPRMTEYDPPAPTIAQRSQAVTKAMEEVRKYRAENQVMDALSQRNGPITSVLHDLPLNSEVLVWREGPTGRSGKWTGPFKLLGMEGETCKVNLPSGPTSFRSTTVKPYLTEEENIDDSDQDDNPVNDDDPEKVPPQEHRQASAAPRRNATRHRQLPSRYRDAANITIMMQDNHENAFDEIGVNYSPFTDSRRKEIDGLLEKGVFEVIAIADVPKGARIFGSRFVDEIKNAGTNKAFEKSRLVVQAFNDHGKEQVLTQSPTICDDVAAWHRHMRRSCLGQLSELADISLRAD